VDCITPNLKEATEGVRAFPPQNDAEVDELGRRILRRLRCHSVLITRSERGMSLYREGKPPLHIPSQAREVFDVTGAGDTVIADLSLALAAGVSLGGRRADFQRGGRGGGGQTGHRHGEPAELDGPSKSHERLGVIPARFAAQRFPGKPLAPSPGGP
jgi:hypothetical protein